MLFRSRPVVNAQPDEHESLCLKAAVRKTEAAVIRRALDQVGGNRTRAADLLGLSHRALLYKIKEYGLSGSAGAKEEAIDESLRAGGKSHGA